MDFKFDGYIYRANASKNPLKMVEKREPGSDGKFHEIFLV